MSSVISSGSAITYTIYDETWQIYSRYFYQIIIGIPGERYRAQLWHMRYMYFEQCMSTHALDFYNHFFFLQKRRFEQITVLRPFS